jgi:hypothetical protein
MLCQDCPVVSCHFFFSSLFSIERYPRLCCTSQVLNRQWMNEPNRSSTLPVKKNRQKQKREPHLVWRVRLYKNKVHRKKHNDKCSSGSMFLSDIQGMITISINLRHMIINSWKYNKPFTVKLRFTYSSIYVRLIYVLFFKPITLYTYLNSIYMLCFPYSNSYTYFEYVKQTTLIKFEYLKQSTYIK